MSGWLLNNELGTGRWWGGGIPYVIKASYWLRHRIVNDSRAEKRVFVLIHTLHRYVIIFLKTVPISIHSCYDYHIHLQTVIVYH